MSIRYSHLSTSFIMKRCNWLQKGLLKVNNKPTHSLIILHCKSCKFEELGFWFNYGWNTDITCSNTSWVLLQTFRTLVVLCRMLTIFTQHEVINVWDSVSAHIHIPRMFLSTDSLFCLYQCFIHYLSFACYCSSQINLLSKRFTFYWHFPET